MSQVHVECGLRHETSLALRGRLGDALAGPCCPPPPHPHTSGRAHQHRPDAGVK